MKKRLFFLFSFFYASLAFSQTAAQSTACDRVKNTYQVLVENPRLKVALPADVCAIVEKERKAETISYYKYSEYITLKIYPTSQLPSLSKELPYIIYKGQ